MKQSTDNWAEDKHKLKNLHSFAVLFALHEYNNFT